MKNLTATLYVEKEAEHGSRSALLEREKLEAALQRDLLEMLEIRRAGEEILVVEKAVGVKERLPPPANGFTRIDIYRGHGVKLRQWVLETEAEEGNTKYGYLICFEGLEREVIDTLAEVRNLYEKQLGYKKKVLEKEGQFK